MWRPRRNRNLWGCSGQGFFDLAWFTTWDGNPDWTFRTLLLFFFFSEIRRALWGSPFHDVSCQVVHIIPPQVAGLIISDASWRYHVHPTCCKVTIMFSDVRVTWLALQCNHLTDSTPTHKDLLHEMATIWQDLEKEFFCTMKRDRDDFQENWTLEYLITFQPFLKKKATCTRKANWWKGCYIIQHHWFKKRQVYKKRSKKTCTTDSPLPRWLPPLFFRKKNQAPLPGFYLHLGGVETRWSHSAADGLFVGHDSHHWAGDLGFPLEKWVGEWL